MHTTQLLDIQLIASAYGAAKYVCSDEDSFSEIALSDASKIASTHFSLFCRSVHVLYPGIISAKKKQMKSIQN